MSTYGSVTYFPKQKVSNAKKTKKWAIECADAAINMTSFDLNTSLRQSQYKKQVNYNLANGILDAADVKEIIGLDALSDTGGIIELQDYPLSKPRINLLVGESVKRTFKPVVRVVNDDAISEKEKNIKEQVMSELFSLINTEKYDEDKTREKLAELERWKNYEAQDIKERMGTQILQYIYKNQNLEEKFMRGMEDVCYVAEELYCVDIIAGETIVRKCSPLNVKTIRSGESPYIEDSDIIVEDGYYPLGSVLDMYYEHLSPAQISNLEDNVSGASAQDGIVKFKELSPSFPSDMFSDENAGFSGMLLNPTSDSLFACAPYDENGNIRVTRVVWKSMRKVGKKSYFDEEGLRQYELVDERYEADTEKGEKVKWLWISEWWETTKLGENTYVKIQPRPIQFRRMDNFSAGGSGYVGTIHNIDIGRAYSLLDLMKPYQYLYDEFLYRIKKAFKKFKMPQIELDMAKIPDDWDLEMWMYYAEELGYIIVDSFKEGKKGYALGKLAGAVGNTTGRMYNPDMGNYIQQHVLMLNFIEKQIGIISGITEQRLGQIDKSETVGGVERAVVQSSHITEKLFKLHENTKLRVLETALETFKYANRNNKSKKVQYVLDDLSTVMLNIEGELFNESDYGIFVSNSSNDTELLQNMKILAHALIQNNKMSITQLLDIYLSPDIASVRRKIEQGEQTAIEREQAKFKQDADLVKQELEKDERLEKEKLATDERKSIRENETKIVIKQLDFPEDKSLEEHKMKLLKEKQELDEDKHEEVVRHNKATEKISEKKKITNK